MTQENPRFAAARIKKLMQADDDVGRISASVPPLVSRCVELFAEELIDRAAAVAQSEDTGGGAIKVSRSDGVRTLKVKHLQQAVKADAQFEMLGGVVAACEDEQAAGKRKAASGASGLRGGGRQRVAAAAAAASGGDGEAAAAAAAAADLDAELNFASGGGASAAPEPPPPSRTGDAAALAVAPAAAELWDDDYDT